MKKNNLIDKNDVIGMGSLLALNGNYFIPNYLTYNYKSISKFEISAKAWSKVGRTLTKVSTNVETTNKTK